MYDELQTMPDEANGLKSDRLLDHINAIHAVAKQAEKSGILVLAGSEVDILADGSLDYEDDLLAKLSRQVFYRQTQRLE